MKKWQKDKEDSDAFLPEIKRILGEHLISEAPFEEDAERNTDLIVLRLEAIRIACRIRSHEYLKNYSDEFTIRAGRPSGTKTELTKIIEGWGDYFFYGFASEDRSRLVQWILGDLRAFRLYYNRCLYKGERPGKSKNNIDGSSDFLAFRHRDIPDFVIAHSTKHEMIA